MGSKKKPKKETNMAAASHAEKKYKNLTLIKRTFTNKQQDLLGGHQKEKLTCFREAIHNNRTRRHNHICCT